MLTIRPEAAGDPQVTTRSLITALAMVCVTATAVFAQELDPNFKSGADGAVYALALQADGKVVVAGSFDELGAETDVFARKRLGRLNSDGTVDAAFNPGVTGSATALALQADGKILVGGFFTAVAGVARANIARLNADGSLDLSFNPGTNANGGSVGTLAVQTDGKILLGGFFNTVGGAARANIARLNADGSIDTSFNPGVDNQGVLALAVQGDGKILLGGLFSAVGGAARANVARLNADGSIDTGFNPGANAAVLALTVQRDGRILLGGSFTRLGSGTGTTPRNFIGRLNTNGSVDVAFNPGADDAVTALTMQADGKILVGGRFTRLGSRLREALGRLNTNGSLDTTFQPVATGFGAISVNELAAQHDGKILVGCECKLSGAGGSTEAPVRDYVGRFLNGRAHVLLNGDNRGDAFIYNSTSGAWAVELAGLTAGFVGSNDSWSPGWSITPAEFNGDGLTDFFLFNTSTGQWFRMLNDGNGAGGFTAQSSAAWGTNWQRFVVDLDGDGISDVFLWDPALGQWFKCLSNAAGDFTYVFGSWTLGWEIYPMQFNADALQDFFLFDRASGQWFWAVGTGGAFTYPQTSFWSPVWTLYPGDYNGDQSTDLLLVQPSTGLWFVATTGAGGFTYTSGFFSPVFTSSIYPMDCDADGKTDLFLRSLATGQWFELLSDGAGAFTNAGGNFWSLGWDLYPTDFNGDGRGDLLLYNPATGVWFQARNLLLGSFSYSNGVWSPGLTIVASRPHFGG